MILSNGELLTLGEARARGILHDPDEATAAATSTHDFRGPDPECYGCLGTGVHQWAGIPKNRCQCTRWCQAHDRYCEEDE